MKAFVDERPVPGESGSALDAEGEDAAETRPVTVDDAYTAQIEFGNGAMGVFEASRYATGHKNGNVIEINGSEGALRFDLERLNELEVHTSDSRGFETVMVTEPGDPYVDHWWPPGYVLGWEHTLIHENYEFRTAVASDESHAPDFEAGLAVQNILGAIERSHERGEWVSV